MPRLDTITDETMQKMGKGAFQFSAAKLDELESAEYTLVTLVIDVSWSLNAFERELVQLARMCVQAAKNDANSERIMYRILTFSTEVKEVHGFKPVDDMNPDDIDFQVESSTALYDATQDAAESLLGYGTALAQNDFSVNGSAFVLTDGMDNVSKNATPKSNGSAFTKIRMTKDSAEGLESMLAILVGMNTSNCRDYLSTYSTQAGFDRFIDSGDLDDATIKQIGGFVSQSVSSQSQAIGTGGPSQIASF